MPRNNCFNMSVTLPSYRRVANAKIRGWQADGRMFESTPALFSLTINDIKMIHTAARLNEPDITDSLSLSVAVTAQR